MKLWDGPEAAAGHHKTCCTLDDVSDARRVAGQLGIPFYVANFKEPFARHVIDDFVCRLPARLYPPNPCAQCNRHLKFAALQQRAQQLGAGWVATGHYASVVRGDDGRLPCPPRQGRRQGPIVFPLRPVPGAVGPRHVPAWRFQQRTRCATWPAQFGLKGGGRRRRARRSVSFPTASTGPSCGPWLEADRLWTGAHRRYRRRGARRASGPAVLHRGAAARPGHRRGTAVARGQRAAERQRAWSSGHGTRRHETASWWSVFNWMRSTPRTSTGNHRADSLPAAAHPGYGAPCGRRTGPGGIARTAICRGARTGGGVLRRRYGHRRRLDRPPRGLDNSRRNGHGSRAFAGGTGRERLRRFRQAPVQAVRGADNGHQADQTCGARNPNARPNRKRNPQPPRHRKRRRRMPPPRKTCRRWISPPS